MRSTSILRQTFMILSEYANKYFWSPRVTPKHGKIVCASPHGIPPDYHSLLNSMATCVTAQCTTKTLALTPFSHKQKLATKKFQAIIIVQLSPPSYTTKKFQGYIIQLPLCVYLFVHAVVPHHQSSPHPTA